MKINLKTIAFFLILGCTQVYGQNFKVSKSAELEVPDLSWNKLLQLKNGNTFYFHAAKKEGVEFSIYNPKHVLATSKNLESKKWDATNIKGTAIKGLYEINGEVVLFVVVAEDRTPILYRTRINGTTGVIIAEDELGRLPRISLSKAYSMLASGSEAPDLYVEKDPESDNYAVVIFNTVQKDPANRIKVTHYNKEHKVLSTAIYESPEKKYDDFSFLACSVDGDKRVFVAIYGMSDNTNGLVVSCLQAGSNTFKHNILKLADDMNDTKAIMVYNKGLNKLQLLTMTYSKTRNKALSNKRIEYYKVLMNAIDPDKLTLTSSTALDNKKVNEYASKHIKNDYEYSGMPQNLIVNADKSTTILSEDITYVSTNHIGPVNNNSPVTSTSLGPAGITILNEQGMEASGYALNKYQTGGGKFDAFYQVNRMKGQFIFPYTLLPSQHTVNSYLSYDFVHTAKGNFILFNDYSDNYDRDEDNKKRSEVSSEDGIDAMCFRLGNDKIEKNYLFGVPGDKTHNRCDIQSSDFNRDTKTYAALMVTEEGKHEHANIAWIYFGE